MKILLALLLGQTVFVAGTMTANHFVPKTGASVPNIFLVAQNVNDGGLTPNPWDAGLSVTAGSTDQAGTIVAFAGYTSGAKLYLPVFCIEPGAPVGAGWRCQAEPSNSQAAQSLANQYWVMDGGIWDAGVGDTLPEFCLWTGPSAINPVVNYPYRWDYNCWGG